MSTFGDVLPLALGVAISPMPVITVILTLLSPRARLSSTAFALGWVVGVAAATAALTSISTLLPSSGTPDGGLVRAVVHLAIGVLLVWLAIRAFRKRPRQGEEVAMPRWMGAFADFTPLRAFGAAALLAAANPKNIVLIGGAAVSIGQVPAVGVAVAEAAVFVLIASLSVLVPVVAFLVASERISPMLEALRDWLTRNSSTIVAVLLAVLAISSIGNGIDAL